MEKPKLTNEAKRKLIAELLHQTAYLDPNTQFHDLEKIYLKICRLAENIYRQTVSSKDRALIVDCYKRTSEFYRQNGKYQDIVQKWYQKTVVILDDACKSYSSIDDYRYLLEWYLTTLSLTKANEDYRHLVTTSQKMVSRAKSLVRKTKIIDDLKFLILGRLYLADGYLGSKKNFRAYFYYQLVAKRLEKVYHDLNDQFVKNDLLDVYQKLVDLTSRKILKILNHKWKMKIINLKENV